MCKACALFISSHTFSYRVGAVVNSQAESEEGTVRCHPHPRFPLELILSFPTKSDTDEKISLVSTCYLPLLPFI